jgi:hypothetical protein
MLATAAPYNYAELDDAAYTYALIHAGEHAVYLGYTTNPRKTRNLWSSRLHNPEGNSKVPRAFTTFEWTPDQWLFRLGKGYPSEIAARDAFRGGLVTGLKEPWRVLNGTVRMQKPERFRAPRGNRPVLRPAIITYEARTMPWPTFLPWVMAANHIGNPTDAQVKQAWRIWHEIHGTPPTEPVPDPDRQLRRARAETNRLAVARWRARRKNKIH